MLTKWCARGMRNADIAAAKIVIAWLCSLQNDEVEKKEGGAEDKEKVKKGGDDRDFLRTIARRSLSLSLCPHPRDTLLFHPFSALGERAVPRIVDVSR